MTNKTVMLAAALTLAAGITVAAGTNVAAQSNTDLNFSQHLAQALGKSEDEVSQALQSFHEVRHQEREAAMVQRLDEAVANGVISEEQKQLILEKHQEMVQGREVFMGMQNEDSRIEHHEEMRQHREEMQAWASENGIDLQALQLGPSEGQFRGSRGRHMMR